MNLIVRMLKGLKEKVTIESRLIVLKITLKRTMCLIHI